MSIFLVAFFLRVSFFSLFFCLFFFGFFVEISPLFLFRQLNSTVENEKKHEKKTCVDKSTTKVITKRRARFEKKQIAELSDPDPVTEKKIAKKESRYYSSGASRAFPRAEASNRRIHRLLVVLLLCCCCCYYIPLFCTMMMIMSGRILV